MPASTSTSPSLSDFHWMGKDPSSDPQLQNLRLNVDALCSYASRKNGELPCVLLPEYTWGGRHLIRILVFPDTGEKWIVRIPWWDEDETEEEKKTAATKIKTEVDTMSLIKERTDGIVPRVYAYETTSANEVGTPFILMEWLPGSSIMDIKGEGLYDRKKRIISEAHHQVFYKTLAGLHAQISSIRLPKIGTVIKRDDGSYDVGPIPELGGPFETATEYFRAWARAESTKFQHSEDRIRKMVPPNVAEQIVDSIRAFRPQLEKVANRISSPENERGPFPLSHPDFYYSNIIVDKSFNILGIIDWEYATTLPCEMLEFPSMLQKLPPALGDPSHYDENEYPLDEKEQLQWRHLDVYLAYVKEAERKLHLDSKLSNILADDNLQRLGYAIRVWENPGKMAFYHKALQYF